MQHVSVKQQLVKQEDKITTRHFERKVFFFFSFTNEMLTCLLFIIFKLHSVNLTALFTFSSDSHGDLLDHPTVNAGFSVTENESF